MLFTQPQTELSSKIHERIYALGRKIVPFEISTAEIVDKEMLDGLRQVYDFTIELLTDMFKDPMKYKLGEKRARIRNGKQTFEVETTPELFIYWTILGYPYHSASNGRGYEWIINRTELTKPQLPHFEEHKYVLDMLSHMGISYNDENGVRVITSNKYPLLPKYLHMFGEACNKRKVYICDYVMSCDFRVFNKRYVKIVDDTMRIFSDNDREIAYAVHNHLAAKKIKPTLKGFRVVEYKYRDKPLLEICGDFPLNFIIALGKNTENQQYKTLITEIEKLPNKDELLTYIAENIGICNKCSHNYPNGKPNPCFREMEFFGKKQKLCGFNLNKAKNKNRANGYTERDVDLLKQIIDLRISTIDLMA